MMKHIATSARGYLAVMLAALIMLVPTPSHAAKDQNSGNQLLEWCTTTGANWASGMCLGAVTGVVASAQTIGGLDGETPLFCARPTVTNGQIVDVVVVYLKNHPELRDQPYAALILLAMMDAFPCNAQ